MPVIYIFLALRGNFLSAALPRCPIRKYYNSGILSRSRAGSLLSLKDERYLRLNSRITNTIISAYNINRVRG